MSMRIGRRWLATPLALALLIPGAALRARLLPTLFGLLASVALVALTSAGACASELDLQLQVKYRRFSGTLKYAAYDAATDTPLAVRDTDKLWAQLDFTW